jgi:hypothetical protein
VNALFECKLYLYTATITEFARVEKALLRVMQDFLAGTWHGFCFNSLSPVPAERQRSHPACLQTTLLKLR